MKRNLGKGFETCNIEAKVWEKNGQKIVFFSELRGGKQHTIASWDIKKARWAKQVNREAFMNALKRTFGDVMEIAKVLSVEEAAWLDFMSAN